MWNTYTQVAVLLCFCPIASLGQATITGKVIDSMGQGIEAVSVSCRSLGQPAILGFARTNSDGWFKLQVSKQAADSLLLDLNHLAYARKQTAIPNQTREHLFRLEKASREIEEVKVEEMPIYRAKDTINFDVDAFASKDDRVIGDIVSKLPGIEMDGDQILYQGKPIQKYMVNNLDLMEGRYSMINKNLPADAVKNVQIVENDQPIKILDSVLFSDQASLNLELKEFTNTGTARGGVGLPPILWSLNASPMTFGRTFQMLNSIQSNNTGHDVAKDLRPFYTGGMFPMAADEQRQGPSFLSIQDVASPNVGEHKWLDNKIFLLSHNSLKKLADGTEIKAQASFFADRQKRSGFTATDIFAADSHITLTEGVDNSYRIQGLNAGLLLEKNEKHVYLRNRLRFQKRWNMDAGDLHVNDSERIRQERTYDDHSISNALSMARFIRGKLVTFNSDIEYGRTPQLLSVVPGQLHEALHGGEPYDRMAQRVHHQAFNTHNSMGFVHAIKRVRISPSLDISYQNNQLLSDIHTTLGGVQVRLDEGYWNDLRVSRLSGGLSLGFSYEKAGWKVNGRLPYRVSLFDAKQQGVRTIQHRARGSYNPAARVQFQVNGNNEFSASIAYGNQYANLDHFYSAYIVNTYRSLQRFSARLLETRTWNSSLSYNYKNPFLNRFAYAGYSYSASVRDHIFQARVDSNGQTAVSILDQQSAGDIHRLSGGTSHFFQAVNTVVKVSGLIAFGRSDYIVNEVSGLRRHRVAGGSIEFINSHLDFLGVTYKADFNYLRTTLANNEANNVLLNNHVMDIHIYPGEIHSLTLGNSYHRSNSVMQRHQFFMDAKYRYTITKWKTDVEVVAQNIFNNDRYTQQFSSDYQFVETHFDLRPRQFLISTAIRF